MEPKNIKMKITIKVSDEKEQMAIANHIDQQLIGNMDYKLSNIVVNIDVGNIIEVYVFEECKEVPTIVI